MDDLVARVVLATRTGGEACRLPAQRRPHGEAHVGAYEWVPGVNSGPPFASP